MESKEPRADRSRMANGVLILARSAIAALLAFGAWMFLLHGRRWFERPGRPDWARVLLCWAEIVGAFLFAFPRTAAAGALVLLSALAWAAGFHFALGQSTGMLWPDFAIVATLAVITHARKAGEMR